MANEANPSLVGRAQASVGGVAKSIGIDTTGLKAFRAELEGASKIINQGLLGGVTELATGGSKVKAVWESIKWAALTRAGLAGFALLVTTVGAFTGGIRKAIEQSEALQAAITRVGQTKVLTKQFEVFLGNVEMAKQRVKELYAFVANSKFDFGDVAAASRTLTILSNGVLGGAESLKMLGKVSSATGVNIQDLSGTIAQLNQQIRNKEDITGSINTLKNMGIISEATAKRLVHLQEIGAPSAAVWKETEDAIKATSSAVGDTELSIEDLEQSAAKARETMLAAFGADFVEAHRREVELTGKAYQNLTPAMAAVGKLLALLTSPAEGLKTKLKEATASEGFGRMAKNAGEFLIILPTIATAAAGLTGAFKLAASTFKVLREEGAKGVVEMVRGAVSPAAEAERMRGVAARKLEQRKELLAQAEQLRQSAEIAIFQPGGGATDIETRKPVGGRAGRMIEEAKGFEKQALAAGVAEKAALGWSKTMTGASKVLGLVQGALVSVAGAISAAIVPMLVMSGVAMVLTSLWNKYQDSLERAAHADEMTKGMAKQNAAINEQIKALKNLDDQIRLTAQARQDLNAALLQQDKVQADAAASEEERSAAAANVANARRNLRKVESADTTKLAPGTEALKVAERRLKIEKQINDMAFDAELTQASAAKQLYMLTEDRLKQLKIIADYEKGAAAQPEIEMARGAVAAAITLGEERLSKAKENLTKAEADAAKSRADAEADFLGSGELAQVTGLRPGEAETKLALEKARATVAEMTKNPGGELLQKAQANLANALDKGSIADKLEAAAEKAKTPIEAAGLRVEAAKKRLEEPEEAAQKAEQRRAQIAAMQRQGAIQAADIELGEKMLAITSETIGAEDKIAEFKKQRIERERALLMEMPAPEKTKMFAERAALIAAGPAKTPEAETERQEKIQVMTQGLDAMKKARENQEAALDLQTAEINKGTAERARQQERDKAAWQSSIDANKLHRDATLLAAKGNFAGAAAAIKAARATEDKQAQLDKARELEIAGVKDLAEINRRVGEEQKQREADRAAAAEEFRVAERRSIEEKELALGVRGLGEGPKGEEARRKLVEMKDADEFRSKVKEGLDAGLEAGEASQLALRGMSADILTQGQAAPGAHQIASSLARVGGGGGVYAGPTGDPQLEAQKRIATLAQEQNSILKSILSAISLNVE